MPEYYISISKEQNFNAARDFSAKIRKKSRAAGITITDHISTPTKIGLTTNFKGNAQGFEIKVRGIVGPEAPVRIEGKTVHIEPA